MSDGNVADAVGSLPMDGAPDVRDGLGLVHGLAYLVQQVAAANSVHAARLGDYGEKELWAAFDGDGFGLVERDRAPVAYGHGFKTLQGLCDYMESHKVDGAQGIAFVGDKVIKADCAYGSHSGAKCNLQMDHSEEYEALVKLFEGVSQKELWRILVTELHGCVEPELLLMIGGLEIAGGDKFQVRIDHTGLSESTGSSAFVVNTLAADGSPSQARIKCDWSWTGRVWKCFPEQCRIDLRLELVKLKDGGVAFVFHPRRLSEVMDAHRAALVDALKGMVPENVTVHEGTY